MSRAIDIKYVEQSSMRKAVIASRGAVSPKACQLIRSLPLYPMGLIALSANNSYPGKHHTGSYTCAGPSCCGQDPTHTDSFSSIDSLYDLSKTCASEGEQIEAVYRKGDLVRVITEVTHSNDVAMTVLFDEDNSSTCRQQIVKDAASILKRTGKPVLAAAGEYETNAGGSLLIAAGEYVKRNNSTECRIDRFVNLAAIESVVLYVANPFQPLFSRMAVGMRSSQDNAIREVHDTQIQEAAEEAMYLCETIRASGAKSWAVGKVGKFVAEVLNILESCNSTLICIPVDNKFISHERRMRSLLMELLENANVPVLILPHGSRSS